MKTIGRFIAVLVALGLLLAVLPIIPAAGAEAGTVTLTGGVTTDSVRWYSTNAGFNVATVSVADADKNVLTELVGGPCTSGTISLAKCTLVGVAGGSTYQMSHGNLEDAGGDDIPDGLLIRALQAESSGFITQGTSASSGAVVLTGNLGAAVAATRLAAISVTADILAGSLDTPVGNYAKVRAVITNAGNITAGNTGNTVTIKGTSVNATTLVETALDSEVVPFAAAGVVANGSYDTTKYWKAGTVSFAVDVSATFAGNYTLALQELGTIAARYKYNQIDVITGRTTLVSSAHTAAPIALTLTETNASSGVFTATATLTATIGSHSTAATGAATVFVTDGALLTFTYNDEDPVAAKTATARADLKAPTIELVLPARDSYTNVSALTFIVKVADEASADGKASGLTTTDIDEIIVAGTTSGVLTPLLTGTNAFQVSYSKTITTEGLTNWWFPAKDKVGNTPVFVDPTAPATTPVAILGAGDPSSQTTQPAKPFKVTIDTAAPTVTASEVQTGGKLTTATTTPFATTWGADAAQRKAVTVKFGLGTGTAPLDSATLSAAAWLVGGTAPSSAAMNTTGNAIVLTMAADQATDATPKVELAVAGLKDKAGNTMATLTGTAAPTAVDKLKPVLDVVVTPANTKTKVTITVTSSETLSAVPTVTVATAAPFNGALSENVSTPTVSATTDIKVWTSEYTAPATAATKRWVKVVGTDSAGGGNVETRGEGTPTTDVITFQVDTLAPLATITPTTAEEGSIFVRVVFDEDEGKEGATAGKARGDATATVYTDGYKKVTLSKATLTNKTTLAVETVTTGYYTKDSIEYVLVKTLGKAKYDVILEFVDEAGNTGTKTQEIDVTARVKTVINLTPGNNFFSLPGAAVSSNINDIIAAGVAIDLVVGYDPSLTNPWLTSTRDSVTGLFVGDLKALEAGKGYIARATAFVDLEVDIPTASYNALPGVTMVKGNAWSLIGPAVRTAGATVVDADSYLAGTRWSVCVTFNPDPGAVDKGWTSVRPDTTVVTANNLTVERGYFCWFQADGTIVQQ
ncbi:MAG: hypothetical protein HW388_292 [Dehalococcoidia bacterium]|nr:hypothetical protein [Dehalococcoidia bacterium]